MHKTAFQIVSLVFVGFLTNSQSEVLGQPPGTRGEKRQVLEEFDADGSGWLNADERVAARKSLQQSGGQAGGGRGFGRPRGGFGFGGPGGPGGGNMPEPTQGPVIKKSSVKPVEGTLYDPAILRTIFIDFESQDWEKELEDFHNTDVDVPATLTVDGKAYPNCGIRFRGASSYDHVPSGYKRSFNVSVDMVDDEQRVLGYKTLNLLNANGDDSLMSSVLYSQVARQYMPAPKANFVRVVVNGEYRGVFTNVQQYNKQFLEENYSSTKGARWKVAGSPRGGGGLDYRGEDPANNGYPYEQKAGGKKALAKLIEFCRVIDQTPVDELPAMLEPICDVDELLWFLALDVGLMNADGYWVRASDYSIYLDTDDKFHFIPHDMNEAFRPSRGGGPGGGRGRGGRGFGGPGFGGLGFGAPGGGAERGDFQGGRYPGDREGRERGGIEGQGAPGRPPEGNRPGGSMTGPASQAGLDPMIAIQDRDKPLRSKILAVPKYRQQYLTNLKTLAEKSLNWETLGPLVMSHAKLLDKSVKAETRSRSTYEAFVEATAVKATTASGQPQRFGPPRMALKQWIDGRHQFLLEYRPAGQE